MCIRDRSPDRHPASTMYHLYALKSAKDLSRQKYFSSGRVDSSRPNGLSMQVARQQQPGAVSAPVIPVGSVWPENNGWSASRVSTPIPELTPREQPVINVRSRVLSPSGSQVGSKVIFPGRDVSSTMPYISSVPQPLLDSPANWTYRL